MILNWTRTASEDLDKIFDFYHLQSLDAATDIYNEILDEAQYLIAFPELGFIEPLLIDKVVQYRSLVIRKIFKLIYYISGNVINITHVWDCRRNPEVLINNLESV